MRTPVGVWTCPRILGKSVGNISGFVGEAPKTRDPPPLPSRCRVSGRSNFQDTPQCHRSSGEMALFLGGPYRSPTGESAQGSGAWPMAGAWGVEGRLPWSRCLAAGVGVSVSHRILRPKSSITGGLSVALCASFPEIFYLRGGDSLRSVPLPCPPSTSLPPWTHPCCSFDFPPNPCPGPLPPLQPVVRLTLTCPASCPDRRLSPLP